MIDRIELRWINTCKVKARNTDKNWPVQKLSGSFEQVSWIAFDICFSIEVLLVCKNLTSWEKKNKPIDERISCIDYINDSLH